MVTVYVLLAVLVAWSALTTVLVLGLTRQVAMLRLAVASGRQPGFDFGADGPAFDQPVPAEVFDVVQQYTGLSARDFTLVSISSSCPPCRKLAGQLRGQAPLPGSPIFLISGGGTEAEDLRETLLATGSPVVEGAPARRLTKLLDVHSTPFAIRIASSAVADKAHLQELDDYLRLVDVRPLSEVLQ
jgi:hypothetical protein